jgi:hypothetical protein
MLIGVYLNWYLIGCLLAMKNTANVKGGLPGGPGVVGLAWVRTAHTPLPSIGFSKDLATSSLFTLSLFY